MDRKEKTLAGHDRDRGVSKFTKFLVPGGAKCHALESNSQGGGGSRGVAQTRQLHATRLTRLTMGNNEDGTRVLVRKRERDLRCGAGCVGECSRF